jgi:hypothetical protein
MTWQKVYKEIDEFYEKWPSSEFGPGHLVIADQNTDDYCVLFCMRETWDRLRNDLTNQELLATMDFLAHIAKIPEKERLEPEEDDMTDPVDWGAM